MSMTGDAEIGFVASVDADAAADELKAEFTRAIAEAMKSPALEQAMRRMALSVGVTLKKSIGDAMSGKGRGGADPFKPLVTSADRAAKRIGERFEKVGRDAARSFDAFRGPGATGLRGMSVQVEAIAKSFDSLREATEGQIRAMESMERLARQSADVQARLNRDLASTEQQTARERLVADQTQTARALSNARRRLEIFRQVAAQIRFVERQLGVAFQRGAEIATRALRGLGRVAESIARNIGQRFTNLFSRGGGAARLNDNGLTQSLRRRERDLQRSFDRQERIMQTSATRQQRLMERMNQQQSRGIAGLVTGRSQLAGALGLGGLFVGGMGLRNLVGGGIGRLLDTEDATVQLQRMGLELEQVNTLLGQVDETFQGTPFSNPDGFNVSAQLYASGRSLEEIPAILGNIADFAAHGNVDLGFMAELFVRIAAQGKVTGEELNRLSDRNIPLTQLAEALGVNVTELRKMVKEGKLTSDRFFEATQSIEMFQGAAKAAGDTTRGAWTNTMTALKRGFEQFFKPFFGENGTMVRGLKQIQEFIKTRIIPVMASFGQSLADALPTILKIGKGLAILGGLKAFGEALRFVAIALRAVLTPMGLLVVAFGAGAVLWDRLSKASEPFRESMAALGESLKTLLGTVRELVTGALTRLFQLISGDPETRGLESIGDAIAGVVEKIQGGIDKVNEWLTLLRDALGLPSGDATAPGGGRYSPNNPFATRAQGIQNSEVAGVLASGQFDNSILIPISELPEEAQKVFAEEFADIEWVSPRDAARIWEQFSPDAQQLEDAVTPRQAAVNKAREGLLARVADIFNLDDAQLERAMSGGGNRLLNILEETWLGPVVRFFRGPFVTGLQAAFGFVTSAIGGVGGFFSGLVSAIQGTESDAMLDKSLGERLYEFFFRDSAIADIASGARDLYFSIVDYFRPAWEAASGAIRSAWAVIEPIIQPFIDGITELFDMIRNLDFSELDLGNVATGGAIGAGAGLLLGGPLGALLGGAAGALTQTPLFSGLLASIDNAWDDYIKPALDRLWNNITGWLADQFTAEKIQVYVIGFYDGIREIGERVGALLSEPETIAGAVAFGAAIASILLAFTFGLVQGIASNIDEWTNIISSGINAAWDAIGDNLDFIPDPIISAFDALTANPVLAAGALALGTGLVATIMSGIGSAIAGRNAAGAAGGKGLTKGLSFTGLATGIVGGLIGAISTAFKRTARGGLDIVKMLFGGDKVSPTSLPADARGKLKAIGSSIASSIIVGIGAFSIGNVAGRSGSIGNVILSILGGAGAGAALGASIGGLPGLVVGAGLGAAITGLGAAIGASGEQAAKAKREIAEYADALIGLENPIETAAAGVKVFLDNLGDEDVDLQEFLVNADFDASGFVDRVIAGTATASDEVARVLESFAATDLSGLSDIVADLEVPEFFQGGGWNVTSISSDVEVLRQNLLGIADIIRREGITDSGTLIGQIQNLALSGEILPEVGAQASAVVTALDEAGFSFSDMVGLFNDEGGELADALHEAEITNALQALADGADVTKVAFSGMAEALGGLDELGSVDFSQIAAVDLGSVSEAAQGIADALKDGRTAEEINEVLGQSNLTSKESIDALIESSDLLRDAAQNARDEVADLIGQRISGLDQDSIRRRFRLDLPDVEQDIADAFDIPEEYSVSIPVNVDLSENDEFTQTMADFRGRVETALSEAIDAGEISSSVDLSNFINDLREDIMNSDLTLSVQNALLGQLNLVEASLEGVSFGDVTELETRAGEAGAAAAAAFWASYERVLSAPQNFSFNQASMMEDTRFGAGRTGDAGTTNPIQDAVEGWATNFEIPSAFEEVGPNILDAIAGGMEGNAAVPDATRENLSTAVRVANVGAIGFIGPGVAMSTAMAAGISAGAGAMGSAVGGAVRQAAIAGQIASLSMFAIGVNLGSAMASGIRSQSGAVAAAAAAVANAAANAARRNLKIASPSRVFVDIGKQVGQGFVKGIEDSSKSMADALSDAIGDAIKAGTEAAFKQVRTAQAGQAIFDALAPRNIPEGQTLAELLIGRADALEAIRGLTTDLRSGASAALSNLGGGALSGAGVALHGARLDMSNTLRDNRTGFNEAISQQKELASWQQQVSNLWKHLQSGQLGWTALIRGQSEAQTALNKTTADLQAKLRARTITQDSYNKSLANAQIKHRQAIEALNAEYRSGALGVEEYHRRKKLLGDEPSALSQAQLDIIRSGSAASLNLNTVQGQANQEAIRSALEQVRSWGESALESGVQIGSVTKQMQAWIGSLRSSAVAQGIAASGFDSIASQLGLTSAQIKKFADDLVSLNQATAAGLENASNFVSQLKGIREFGSAMIGSGVDVASVVNQMKSFRNQLLQQATAFGFSGAELAKLVEQVGLSDSALADFVRQMREFEKAANEASAAPDPTPSGPGPTVGELNVYVPYGDPEAVGMTVANRLAYRLPRR